jgi:O-methyltransferase domain
MQPSSIQETQTTTDIASVMRLIEISTGYWLPRVLHIVADLGVADALDDEPRSAAFLAREIGADSDALDRALRLLASRGIFRRSGGMYSHNELSRALRNDDPHSMRAYVQLVGLPFFWNSWGTLEQVVRTGKPAMTDAFAYLRDHPGETAIFDAGMKAKAQTAIPMMVAAYDFSSFATVADIGGGLGHLLKAILKSSPRSRGVLFDQPHVIERVEPDEAIGDRMVLQDGDFFRGPLPQCNAYILMEILHDWADEQSRAILKQIRNAAPEAAHLLVVETVIPNEKDWSGGKCEHFGHLLDINMLVLTSGRERTSDEFSRLFAETGWQLSRVIQTAGPYSIVEAVTS